MHMNAPKTLVSVEPIAAMIQQAQNLLDEATALGQQYVAHSQDILGSGWGGDAATTSLMVSEQVNGHLGKMVAAHTELNTHLNNFSQQAQHQEESARNALNAVIDTAAGPTSV
jgi:uncharacterized protein YukE